MGLLEVHSETHKNAILEPVRRLELLYQAQRLLLLHYHSSLGFFSVRFFFFSVVFWFTRSHYGENNK